MQYIVKGTQSLNGKIKLPASKSISNRALILNALSKNKATINNLSDCDDTNVMVAAFASDKHFIDVKAAGTSMRFLTAYLAQNHGEWTITGTERMQQRPIHILVDAINSLGGKIEYINKVGFPPLKIKGTSLDGGEIFLSGGVSSQFISALLMIAPTMKNGLTIHIEGDPISLPYINLTLGMMLEFGVRAHWNKNTIRIYPELYNAPSGYLVESDWSAASYWYQMLALAKEGEIELEGLFKNSKQGDSKVSELFLDLGIETIYTESGVVLKKTNRLTKKMFHNFVNEPDLAQTFAVTACMLNIPFMFTGLQTLKIKETDRIEALKKELKKLGFILHDSENSILQWDGEVCQPDKDAIINTYEDHRMAMAFAPAAIKMGHIIINEPTVVSKSYPRYWEHLKSMGFEYTQE